MMMLGRQLTKKTICFTYNTIAKKGSKGVTKREISSVSDEFRFSPIINGEHEKYLSLMMDQFLSREPLNLGLHLHPDDGKDFIQQGIIEWGSSGASVEVVHTPSNELAGAFFCKILTRDDKLTFKKVEPKECDQKMYFLQSILCHLEQSYDPFKNPSVTKVLELATVAVDKKFSGKNLSYRLIKECENIGRASGCQLATSQLTSAITQHMFKKIGGYNVVYTLDYESFEINGKKVLDVCAMGSTTMAKVVVKNLNSIIIKPGLE